MSKKSCFYLILLLALPGFLSGQPCGKSPGFYRDTVGDLENDPAWFYLWYLYKDFHPIRRGPEQIENYFKSQDLDFGTPDPGSKINARVKLVAAGDLMAKTGISLKNSSHLFDDLSGYLKSAELAFANLESPSLPGKPTSVFPRYNFDSELVRKFQDAGFDLFSTANNHCLDQGPEGLVKTLDFLDQLGIYHTGTARSPEEQDQGFPILEVNGIRIAFLAYTFSTNNRKIPPDQPWMVNRINFNLIDQEPDLGRIEKDIATARKKGAEVVIVSNHWALEYEFYPPERIISRAHQIVEMGADIIIGHHPHCLQPMERYIPKNPGRQGLSEALIVYSLGNLIPDHFTFEFKTSALLGIELAKGNLSGKEKIWINKIEIIPTFFLSRLAPTPRFQILRTDQVLNSPTAPESAFLQPKNLDQIKQAQTLVEQILVPDGKSLADFLPEN